MTHKRLVIFDLDGTLVDAYEAISKSFNHTMRVLGYPFQSRLTIRRAVGFGDANLLKLFVSSADLKKALVLYRRHHRSALRRYARLLPGARRLLRALSEEGFILAVASNRPSSFSLLLMRSVKIKEYFRYTLCADKLKKGKPHPDILQRIMRRFCVKPREAFYIGDMAIDAEAGRRARVRSIIVTTGSSSLREIKREKPYRIVKKLVEILPLVTG